MGSSEALRLGGRVSVDVQSSCGPADSQAGKGEGGAVPPLKRYLRTKIGSDTSSWPSPFESQDSSHGGSSPPVNWNPREELESEMSTAPSPLQSPRSMRLEPRLELLRMEIAWINGGC